MRIAVQLAGKAFGRQLVRQQKCVTYGVVHVAQTLGDWQLGMAADLPSELRCTAYTTQRTDRYRALGVYGMHPIRD